LQDLELV